MTYDIDEFILAIPLAVLKPEKDQVVFRTQGAWVDTGAYASVISEALWLRLQPFGFPETTFHARDEGVGGIVRSYNTRSVQLTVLFNRVVFPLWFHVLPVESNLPKHNPYVISLGCRELVQMELSIDYSVFDGSCSLPAKYYSGPHPKKYMYLDRQIRFTENPGPPSFSLDSPPYIVHIVEHLPVVPRGESHPLYIRLDILSASDADLVYRTRSALVDTGASISTVSEKLLEKFRKRGIQFRTRPAPMPILMVGYYGEPIPVSQRVLLHLRIAGVVMPLWFYIDPSPGGTIQFGNDHMWEQKMIIDFETETLTLGKRRDSAVTVPFRHWARPSAVHSLTILRKST